MKLMSHAGFALLTIVIACSMAKAESVFERRTTIDGIEKRIYDVMLESKVSPTALKKALEYFDKYEASFPNKNYITLIDYSKPSSEPRLYLFDMKTGKYEKHLVAHGSGSGALKANRFSNGNGSAMTSLGFYRTAELYNGKHGRSLRLDGLSTTNKSARARAVVVHAAGYLRFRIKGKPVRVAYVSPEMVRMHGRLGRSQGCPALDPRVTASYINRTKHGSMMYAF